MKCLVMGGGGFIGSAVTDELLEAGYDVRIFEKPNVIPPPHRVTQSSVEWMSGNFLEKGALARAVAGVDAVFHLVSTTLPKSSNDDPIFDIQSNVGGTLHLLDQMAKHGIRRIVFASSGGTVYGLPQHIPIPEDHSTDPLVSYGIAKLAIEKYLALYQRQYALEPVILRVANPYGRGQRVGQAQGAVGEFITRALSDQQISIWGDGSVVRDYVYLSDVARAFRLALEYQGGAGLFNIGSGTGQSLNDLTAAIETILGRPVKCKYNPGRDFDVPVNVLDISRARQELGWAPETDLISGLRKTIEWFAARQSFLAHSSQVPMTNISKENV